MLPIIDIPPTLPEVVVIGRSVGAEEKFSPFSLSAAGDRSSALGEKSLTIGVCLPVPNVQGMWRIGGENALEPAAWALMYLEQREKAVTEPEILADLLKSAKVKLIQEPMFGALSDTTRDFPEPSAKLFFYNPTLGDMREDRVVYLVEMGDYRIKVIFDIYPVPHGTGPETESKICGKRGVLYKV